MSFKQKGMAEVRLRELVALLPYLDENCLCYTENYVHNWQ